MIGDARIRIVFEAKILTADDGGGFSEDWEPYGTAWADLQPQSGSETVQAGRGESRTSHRMTVRRRTDVSANHRIRAGTRIFAIRALVDEGPHAPWMTLLCEEGAPS